MNSLEMSITGRSLQFLEPLPAFLHFLIWLWGCCVLNVKGFMDTWPPAGVIVLEDCGTFRAPHWKKVTSGGPVRFLPYEDVRRWTTPTAHCWRHGPASSVLQAPSTVNKNPLASLLYHAKLHPFTLGAQMTLCPFRCLFRSLIGVTRRMILRVTKPSLQAAIQSHPQADLGVLFLKN